MKKHLFHHSEKVIRKICITTGITILFAVPQMALAQYGLFGFGSQANGRLGNGSTSGLINPSTTPLDNGANGKFIDIAPGANFTLGIKEDGSLWAWGSNTESQLGSSSLSGNIATPTKIDDGSGAHGKWVRVFVAELYSSFGLREDGSLWAWGKNNDKQLGLPGTPGNNVSTPTQVSPGTKWIMVDGGSDDGGFVVGIQQDSSLWVWGSNVSRQLGTGNNTNQPTPFQIMPNDKWIQISTGAYFTLAIKADGSLWGWGKAYTGVASTLGDGALSGTVASPKQIDPGTGASGKWVKVAAGPYHSLAIREDGSLWAWGQNGGGRLGDGTTTSRNYITKIDNGTNGKWIDVGASVNGSFGMKDNNKIYTWGEPDGAAVGGPPPYHSTVPKEITEAGTLKNGKIFIGRQHFYWINDLPIRCDKVAGLTVNSQTRGGATISWLPTEGASNYEIAIDKTNALNPTASAVSVSDTFYISSGLQAGETYYAHVRTSCGTGAYSEWDTISFTTLPCLPPLNITPGIMSINGGTISWDPVLDAAGYEVVVDQSATLTPTGAIVSLTDTFYNAALTPDDLWYVHIRTNCGGGNYSEWDTVSFTTPAVCQQANNFQTDAITDATATIIWDTVLFAMEYEIAVDQSPTLAPAVAALVQTSTSYTAILLNEGETYYAHLRSHCGNGNYSEWDTLSFTTTKYTSTINFSKTPIQIFPNPAGDFLYVIGAQGLSAHIYNIHGQEVISTKAARTIELAKLSAGMYILKLTNETGTVVETMRFVKHDQ